VDKPPSPQAKKTTSEPSKPPSLTGARGPIGAGGTLTSPTHMALGLDAANNSPRPESFEQPEIPPLSPWCYELGAPGGSQNGEGSTMPRSRKQPRPFSHVAESLWDNPYFIQARFHIGRYVIASVNSEAEWKNIRTLYSSLKTTSAQINVNA
jgi:hypothetical protein